MVRLLLRILSVQQLFVISFCLLATLAGAEYASSAPSPADAPGAETRSPRSSDPDFPRPAGLEQAVQFWKRVYLEVATDGGLLHDSQELGVVYEVISFGSEKSQRRREAKKTARRRYWRDVLHRLRRGEKPRDEAEAAVPRMFHIALGRLPIARDYSLAARRIRFQLGQRDKFRSGLLRSGAYEDAMRAVFHSRGLPEDLAFLPHVESSFNVHAYSKYGAAGVWQFMRSTGRRYMQIDYTVDERLDPMIATDAAAQLLEENYRALRSWPLAITAYNHGRSGMKRAKRKVGTDDIAQIVRRYKSRTFGFASRNFYAQFLAAREIVRSYQSHFGPLRRDKPEAVDEITLPFYAEVAELREDLNVSPEVIQHYNPALRPPIFRSKKRIPKGYVLRLPAGTVQPNPEAWLAAVEKKHRHGKQRRLRYYQVRRGDTLSRIASRQHTSVGALVVQNNLPSRHRIYPGQVLELPDPGAPLKRRTLVKAAQAAPAPVPTPAPEPQAKPPAPEPAPEATSAPVPTQTPTTTPTPTRMAVAEKAPAQAPPKSAKRAPAAETPPAEVPAGAQTARLQGPELPGPPPLAEDSPWRRIDGSNVIVDSDETLGHFADWLEIPTQRLRNLNDFSYGKAIHMGQRLRLDFSRVPPAELLQKRMEYHKGIEEDFLSAYRISGTQDHTMRKGENLWTLANRIYDVPAWLIHRYNPHVDLTQLVPGTELQIPVVEPLSQS